MKGRIASKYYVLADEAWAEVSDTNDWHVIAVWSAGSTSQHSGTNLVHTDELSTFPTNQWGMFILLFGYCMVTASFVVCRRRCGIYFVENDRFEVKHWCLMLHCQNRPILMPMIELGTQNGWPVGQAHVLHSHCTEVQPIFLMSNYHCPIIGRSLIFETYWLVKVKIQYCITAYV